MVSYEWGEAGDVLVVDVEAVRAQLVHRGVHVPRVEQHERVEDQAEGAELVLSELAQHGLEPADSLISITESSGGETGELGVVGRVGTTLPEAGTTYG